MNNDPNSPYYKAHIAFLAAHDDFDANQRRQFGCACGDNRHIDTHWDHQTRRSWKALCAARKVWSDEMYKDLASRVVAADVPIKNRHLRCNWTVESAPETGYNQDETNG